MKKAWNKWPTSTFKSGRVAWENCLWIGNQMHLEFQSIFFFSFYSAWGTLGAFKKLKSESSSSLGGGSSGGIGGSINSSSCVGGSSHLHNPSAASCPTPARRRHRTTFTQVPYIFTIHHLGPKPIYFKYLYFYVTTKKKCHTRQDFRNVIIFLHVINCYIL